MRELKAKIVLSKMKPGAVYRRAELAKYSNAVDRHMQELVEAKQVLKVSAGLYVKPKDSVFGVLPPNANDVVFTFLKDKRFLINSYNNYNQLGLGLTQLYNNNVVYNHKRHGEFELFGKKFSFKRIPHFPKALSKEFLLIDLLNNIKDLAEDEEIVINNFFKNKNNFDSKKVVALSKSYGRSQTQKIIEKAYINV